MSNTESLAEYVTRIMEVKKLSSRDVQINSGSAIHQSEVVRITTGGTKRPGKAKQAALAKGLGVNEEEIFVVINGAVVKTDFAQKIKDLASGLPVNVQEDLLVITEALSAKYAK